MCRPSRPIVVLRYYVCAKVFDRQKRCGRIAAAACVGLLFVAAQFLGNAGGLPEAEFGKLSRKAAVADPKPHQSSEFQLHLVNSARFPRKGDRGYTGARMPAQFSERADICIVGLVALTRSVRYFADLIRIAH